MQNPYAAQRNHGAIPAWWSKRGKVAAEAVIATAKGLSETQMGIQTRNFRSALLYGGNQYLSSGRFSPKVVAPSGPIGASGAVNRSGPRYNLIHSMVNTVAARILAPGLPRVAVLTNDGDFELQHKAKLLDQYVEGLSYQVELEATNSRVLKDCCAMGTGYTKFWADEEDNIHADRCFPNEFWVEMWDGRDQAPRRLYQIYVEDKDRLAKRFPKFKSQILAKGPIGAMGNALAQFNSNAIPVFESWSLPTSHESGDGRHILTLEDMDPCIDEEWVLDDFPVSVLRYDDGLTGFQGIGLAELLYGHQSSLNDVLRAEFWAHSQMSMPRLWLDINSKINKNHAQSSRSGLIMEGVGSPPTVLNWDATTNNFVGYRDYIVGSAYEFVGLSKLAAQGLKPAGLNSGVAQREFMDIQQDRMAQLSLKWGWFHVDCAKQMIRLAKTIYERNKSYKIKVIGKNFIKEIDWGDIDLDDEEFRLKLYPAALLPRTPAGRLQKAQELGQSGLFGRTSLLRMIDAPDTDDELSLLNAARDNARRTAYLMLHEGKYNAPDPLQDPEECIPTIMSEALRAQDNGAPPERIDLCRRWLKQAQVLWPQFGQPQPMQPGPPQAAPAKPPVSDLLPNAPQKAA